MLMKNGGLETLDLRNNRLGKQVSSLSSLCSCMLHSQLQHCFALVQQPGAACICAQTAHALHQQHGSVNPIRMYPLE